MSSWSIKWLPTAWLIAALAFSAFLTGPSSAQTPVLTGPAQDANGWTVFTPSSDSQIVYVSSSTGNDANNGLSQSAPVKTLMKAVSLVREGYPDWILLKKGDTWTDEAFSQWAGYPGAFCKSGRSSTEPMLISSYGSGARPLLKTSLGSYAVFGSVGASWCPSMDYVALVGLEFYQYKRDPASPNYDPSVVNDVAIQFFQTSNWILLEDNKFTYYGLAVNVTSGKNVYLRRNVTAFQYANSTSSFAAGFLISGVTHLTLEGNLSYHDGWSEVVAGGARTTYNHGYYLQTLADPDMTTVTHGNTVVSASFAGIWQRRGGLADNNLLVKNGMALGFGYPDTPPVEPSNTIVNNVVLQSMGYTNGASPGGPAWGIIVYPLTYATLVQNNLLANDNGSGGWIGIGLGTAQNAGYVATNTTVQQNVICKWQLSASFPTPIQDWGSVVYGTSANNVITSNLTNGSTLGCSGFGFTDPTRTVDTYDAQILGGPGTLAHFISLALSQSKDSWNTALTAQAVNDYIRGGYNLTAVATTATYSGSTAGTTSTSGTVSTSSSGTTSTPSSGTTSTSNSGTTSGSTSSTTTTSGTTSTTTSGTTSTTTSGTTSSTSSGSTSSSSKSPAPVVTMNSPTAGTTVKGNRSLNITVSAVAAQGLSSLTILADGTPIAKCGGTSTCSSTWQGKSIAQGTHSISALALATDGQIGTASVTITSLH